MCSHQTRRKRALIAFMAALAVMVLAACPSKPVKTPQQQAEELYQQGLRLIDNRQLTEAITAWEKAIEIYPQHSGAHFKLGLTYKKVGDMFKEKNDIENAKKAYSLAIIHYQKVAELTPNDPAVHNNLANVFYSLQNYDGAIQGYNKAILLKPYDPDYHYNLANAYSKKGLIKQAIEHYEEAIRIDPNYFDAYYNLARLYEKSHDINNAIRYYQEYVNRENRPGEAEWVERARRKIYKLRGGGAIY